MFFKRRKEAAELPSGLVKTRNELSSEVSRWWNEIDNQIDNVMAQYQMTFLFPAGLPDDEATKKQLETEQIRLRNMVAEYDNARATLIRFAREHPEIHCSIWEDSHKAIHTMLRWKNKKRG